jgi:hypothetical protein
MAPLTMPSSTGTALLLSQGTTNVLPSPATVTVPPLTQQVSAAVAARSLQPLSALTSAASSAPSLGPLLRGARGFVPEVKQKQSSLTGALQQLNDALPPAPNVQRALARMSPAQRTVVANTALLLLAKHQDGQINGANFRAALQQLLNDGAGIQVGTPAGAAGAGSSGASPLKMPRLPLMPEKGMPALPRRLPLNTQAQPGGSATGPVIPPNVQKAIERLTADRSAVVQGFIWPSEPHLSIEAILDAIARGSPQEIGALLRELAHLEPEVYRWLVQQDFFVEAIGRKLDVADLPRALEIPQLLRHQLRAVLPANFEPTGRDLLATMLSLSQERGALGQFKQELLARAPALHQWLQEQPWFTQLLNWSAGLAPSDQRLLTLRNEQGQPVRTDVLPAYDADSTLYISYAEGAGGTQRLFVVPGADATVDGAPAPGRLEAREDPFAALVQARIGQTRGLHPLQGFTAKVKAKGLLQIIGVAQPNDNVMQVLADTSQRPVLRIDGAAAAPAVLKQQLKHTGFVFSQSGAADRVSEDLRLTRAVVRLAQHFGVDTLPKLLQSVRNRLPAENMSPEANAPLADFMRLMQHDSAPEAKQLAAESMARKLGLDSPRSADEKRAKTLLDEVIAYVDGHDVHSLDQGNARLLAQLRDRHGVGWLRGAMAELQQRTGGTLTNSIVIYHRELLDFAAPNRR